MAVDRRKKNSDWLLTPLDRGEFSTSEAQLAVLMDIRDELQTLNSLLACSSFTGIPATLRAIQRNTTRKKR